MTLSCASSAADCPHDPEQDHRLRHAFEFMAAALFGDEQAGDLTLNSRRDHDRTRLGRRLYPRCDIRHVAENFARCIHHHRPRIDGNPGASSGLPVPAFFLFNSASARWIPSAARTARSASFSCATG
jgi:hypothetical protein